MLVLNNKLEVCSLSFNFKLCVVYKNNINHYYFLKKIN